MTQEMTLKQRLAPFLALLEARYAPLLCSVAPQAYAVFLWLWEGSNGSWAAFVFSILGAMGYESVYVGAIAWTLEGRKSKWTWATSFVALAFSVLVAGYVYFDTQGWWALLHSGFPLVGFCYTMALHERQTQLAVAPALPALLPAITQDAVVAKEPSIIPEPATVAIPTSATIAPPVASSTTTLDELLQEQAARSSTKEAVDAYLDAHPHAKIAELLDAFPGKARGTLSGYLSNWQKARNAMATNGNGRG